MTTITKERLLTIKQWRETYGPSSNVVLPAEEAEELARIALASLEAEAVMFCISGQNVDSEEHVSTSKAVVDAWVEEWNQVDRSPGEPLYKTMPLYYHAALPAPVVPEEATPENVEMLSGYVSTYKLTDSERDIAAEIWNACRTAMLQSGNFRESKNSSTNNFREIPEASTSSPVTPALLPGGFTIEEAKELHEDLVRSHISKALSGEKMKKKDRDADLRWIHGVIVQAAWFVKASLEQNALSGNSPVTPDGW
ncbi:TPA: dTDP-6-deoxy-L-hexose 3-O-methyltransferase, partial [Escherichia coli]|nr:dTDP-6-deoxy-L-hexose 3-O-methyltransferase [Escherichia coli]